MTKPLWMLVREAFERKNYFPPSSELRDELVGIAIDYAEQKTAAARAEIERLNNALTEAVNQISDLAARLGRAEGRLDASELVGVVEGWKARAEKAEAERDEARAQVAAAATDMRERAADEACYACGSQDSIRILPIDLDAQSALEAYGREKVRDGMQRAANIARTAYERNKRCPDGCACDDGFHVEQRILAEMEKLK